MLAADNWCVKVQDKVYGPYSAEQLRKFAQEGRLAAWSQIAPAGGRNWRAARDEPRFASFFGGGFTHHDAASGNHQSDRQFGRRYAGETAPQSVQATEHAPEPKGQDDERAFRAASRTMPSPHQSTPAAPRRAKPLGQHPRTAARTEASENANFILVFDVISAAASRVEPAVASLGPCFRIAENVWSVNCKLTAIGVRNAVAPFLRPNESIFVVDASNGRSTWQNYAPAAHAKITDAYMRTRSVA